MKLATFTLPAFLLLASLPSLTAADRANPGEVAIGFAGGSVWTSASTGICVWYLPVAGDLKLSSLFASPLFGQPTVDKEHSYLIWVSDFSIQMLPSDPPFQKAPALPNPYQLVLAPTGTATIYFTNRPDLRDWKDLTERSTWGEPVAVFTRKASLLRSADTFASDTFIFSAELVSSKPFKVNGESFDFKDLIPQGMTCHEHGQAFSSWEAGVCIAQGK
jgi:hypothetical protein